MRANGIFSDANLERLHSVNTNRVMSPSDNVDLQSPPGHHIYWYKQWNTEWFISCSLSLPDHADYFQI